MYKIKERPTGEHSITTQSDEEEEQAAYAASKGRTNSRTKWRHVCNQGVSDVENQDTSFAPVLKRRSAQVVVFGDISHHNAERRAGIITQASLDTVFFVSFYIPTSI